MTLQQRLSPLPALWLMALALILAPTSAWAGTVLISNKTTLNLTLKTAEGAALGTVAPSKSLSLVLADGPHQIIAYRPNGAPYSDVKLTMTPQGGPSWEIIPTEGRLEVRNLSTEPMTIYVDDQPLLDLAPNATGFIDDMRPGKRGLKAVSKGSVMAVTVADIKPNTTWTWRLAQTGVEEVGGSILRVSNFAGEYVDVFIAGEKRVGIFPGDSAAIVGLPSQALSLEAKNLKGEVVSKESINLTSGASKRWVVTGADGGRAVLEVLNQRDSSLRICVDGAYCLRAEPGAKLQYDGVRPGTHTLEAYELKGDTLLKSATLDLTVGQLYRWVLEAP